MSDAQHRNSGRLPDLADAPLLDSALEQQDGRWALTISLPLPRPVSAVWPWLTDPDRLARWSPAVPDRPLTSQGPAIVRERPDDDPNDGEVLFVDPPNELAHRWGDTVLRWTLRETESGCILELEQLMDDPAQASVMAAGWHVCLAVLDGNAHGIDVPRVVGADALTHGWTTLDKRYAAALSGSGTRD